MASISINGDVSGSITVTAPTVAGTNTLTLPAATDTLVGKATTDTLTNKTLSTNCVLGTSLIVSRTAQASTSGTSIDFTSIPSWVKRVTVMFNGVSLNGTANYLIQLGTSSGITSSGYVSGFGLYATTNQAISSTSTSGFPIYSGLASRVLNGIMTVVLFNTNTWTSSHSLAESTSTGSLVTGGGYVALANTLDRLRITTTNGTDSFDAGSINIMYE